MIDGRCDSIKAYLPLAHHVLEFGVCFAGHLLQFLQRVEACIDELQQILSAHLAGTGYLTEYKGETAQFVFITSSYVA